MIAPFKRLAGGFALIILATWFVPGVGAGEVDWLSTVAKARGQTVYWNAWEGDDRINAYMAWAARLVQDQFDVEVRHVKLTDTAEAVTRVLAEKSAGRIEKGSVDLIWINGENFAAMKEHGLLYGPFTQKLPNFRLVDTESKPTLTDFTSPVDGLEAPWSMAQFVFLYDTARLVDPPRTPDRLLAWAKAHPGRFTYPQPPDFLGTTFLKQTLLSLLRRADLLHTPASDAEFAKITAPLWEYLDALRPVMWRQGRTFPANGPAQTRLLADGEIDIALSFSPEAASSAIFTGQLPGTVRTFVFEGGTIGNASFLAIPFNSSAKEGALVLINFLLSPSAQARKQDPRQLGSLTVLAMEKLSPTDRALFEKLPGGPATLSPKELGKPLSEPHPFWTIRLEKEWQKRYGVGRGVVAGFRPGWRGRLLRWMSPVTACLLVAPVVAGLIGTLLPALGYFPPLGGTTVNLESWRRLFELPGLWTSIRLSLVTGLVTTVVSLALVAAFCAAWHGTRLFVLMERLLAPLLSVPHVAVAFGIAFLLAPSGWILRSVSPWATGFTQPPDWLIVQDSQGLTLMLGLIAKEVPFLLVMTLAALGQADAERSRTVARTLGYGPMNGWLKVVFPRVYPQIRLPVFAVLAYGVSVVDVGIILGPTTPAPLAVRLVRLFNDPDLEQRFIASAGALLQLGLVAIGLAIWLALEVIIRRLGRRWISSGNRGRNDLLPRFAAAGALGSSAGAVFAGLLSMVLWSFAKSWRFPDALPSGLTLANWTRNFSTLHWPLLNTVTLGGSAVVIALLLAVGVLEHEARSGHRAFVSAAGVLYLPLVVPQIAFLFGAQILLVLARVDGRWIALTWMHVVFVFPYVFLSLSDTYRAWDERYNRTGLCLGATPARVFLRIKVPMLLRPITTAGAVGFAVSAGLYLPTLFAGSGRYPTLTTEAVTLSAGGDNRLIGVYALLQMTLPLLAFTLAFALPGWLFRHRQGMQVTR